MIISKFRNCSETVKCRLYQYLCSTIYCSSIWSGFTVESMRLLKIAYNRIFRILMHLNHRSSMFANFDDLTLSRLSLGKVKGLLEKGHIKVTMYR